MVRINDWRYSLIPMIFGNLYLWLYILNIKPNQSSLFLLILSLIVSMGLASLGYFINEFFDRKDDVKAGKKNLFVTCSSIKLILILIISLAFSFTPWIYLPFNKTSILLLCIQLLLYVIYSFPLFRLKENAYISIILDAGYAYVIPLLLSFVTFYLFSNVDALPLLTLVYYTLVYLFAGIRNLVTHQVDDILYDKAVNNTTLPQILGISKTDILIKSLIVLEFTFLVAFSFSLKKYSLLLSAIVLIPIVTQTFLFFLKKKKMSSPYIVFFENREGYNSIYQIWLPIVFIVLMTMKSPLWFLILPFHLILFANKTVLSKIINSFRTTASLIINYSIFYLFMLFGVNLKKENKDAILYLRLKWLKK